MRPTISYVTPHGTLTWTPATETTIDDDLIDGGYLFGPTPLTTDCRDILAAQRGDTAEVRYGCWYDFTTAAEPTLPDLLAAMLLTRPGHLDEAGWDILADRLDTNDQDAEPPVIR